MKILMIVIKNSLKKNSLEQATKNKRKLCRIISVILKKKFLKKMTTKKNEKHHNLGDAEK